MADLQGLRAIFIECVQGRPGVGPIPDDLDERLSRLWSDGSGAWPELIVSAPRFVVHVAERLAPDAGLGEALAKVHAADLYLACACAHGVRGAVALFERRYADVIAKALRRIDSSATFIDEARQVLLQRVFVADGGAPARIATYSGRGPLASWIAVAAQRTGLNLLRGEEPCDRSGDGAIYTDLPAGLDPELDYLRARYRREFREAFQDAIAALSERERMILRLHFVSGLPHDRIAVLYKVNQSTVTRWIAKARATILSEVQRHLRERLNMGASELRSIAALVASQLDLSLARWFGGDRE